MRKNKFIPSNKLIWTDDQLAFLKANHKTLTNVKLSEALGVKLTSTRTKLYELGLYKMRLEYWTEEQVQFLREHYKIFGDVELGEIFNAKWKKNKGWSKKHIEKKRRYLGLKRSKQQKDEIQERNRLQGRFSINHWKRWIGRTATIGEVRIWKEQNRPYKVVKTENGFVSYPRMLWTEKFGAIPKGFNVMFRDGNTLNCELNNLELVSDEQLAIRNGIQRFPVEIRKAIHTLAKLKRKIKSYEKQD
jgi:hypothetical protein